MAKKISDVPEAYDPRRFRQIVQDIEARFKANESEIGKYTIVAGYVPTRTLDMGTATAADIGNFLATLVADLQGAGKLGK